MDSLAQALTAVEELLTAAASTPWALLVLFLACVLDGFFPPVPSETVLVAVATLTWTSDPGAVVVVVLTATAGAWSGDNLAYLVGRRLGSAPMAWMRRPRFSRLTERVRNQLRLRPASIVVTGRFVPVARVLVSLAAGATPVPYRRKFLLLSLLGAGAWSCATVAIAVVAGSLVPGNALLATVCAVALGCAAGLLTDRVLAWRRAGAAVRGAR